MSSNNPKTSASSSLGRRSFLQKAGIAASAIAGGAATFPQMAFGQQAIQRGAGLDAAVLNFALNLEYLEAEYYLYATTGAGLAATDITGTGTQGTTSVKPTSTIVPFTTPNFQDYANEIASDEQSHVKFIRQALTDGGSAPVARPNIDLQASFIALGDLIGVSNFDPFANETNFLLGAFIFEDVGVTAFKGAARLLSNKDYLEAAAGILGVEAYHSGAVRALLVSKGAAVQQIANDISDLRDSLDGATDIDQGVTDAMGIANLVPNDPTTGVAYSRDTRQVLNIVYGAVGATSGLFFPNGLNGAITQ